VLDPAAVRARLADVRDRIARAAARAGRDPSRIHLIAISKTFGADAVRTAAGEGQIDFGENKLQEAQQKRQELADLPLKWHLVGHLQSNKARRAAAEFDVIHSIDSVSLLERIDEAAAAIGRRVELLVQVDLAREPTKHGALMEELGPIFDAARRASAINLIGLMLLPPAVDNPEAARPWFRKLRGLRDTLQAEGAPANMLTELSMGMSHDYEIAVEEGATFVRVGTAIFGRRGSAA
jgi:pyridoxal phosphate enzyme (YggS family)